MSPTLSGMLAKQVTMSGKSMQQVVQEAFQLEYLADLYDPDEYFFVREGLPDIHPRKRLRLLTLNNLGEASKWQYITLNSFRPHSYKKDQVSLLRFHSFIIEIDPSKELEAQLACWRWSIALILIMAGLPFTAAVDAANKSIHLQIRLAEDICEAEWRSLMGRLIRACNAVLEPYGFNVDSSMDDPSKLCRLGGGIRLSDDMQGRVVGEQCILELRGRVPKAEFLEFCEMHDGGVNTDPSLSPRPSISTLIIPNQTFSNDLEGLRSMMVHPDFIPKKPGERNQRIQLLVPYLKRNQAASWMLENCPEELVRIFRETWWPLARGHCNARDFNESRKDLLSLSASWRGDDLSKAIIGWEELALEPALQGMFDPIRRPSAYKTLKLLYAIHRHTQAHGRSEFYLSCRTVAKLIRRSLVTAYKCLRTMERRGIVRCIMRGRYRSGVSGPASTYIWLPLDSEITSVKG